MVVDKENRNRQILSVIVELYIQNPSPVSSKVVADEVGMSSATVRNVMSELEQAGLIHQPHTSAGRTPTTQAYRQYARNLVDTGYLTRGDLSWIRNRYFNDEDDMGLEDLIGQSLKALSEITQQACIALLPDLERGCFRHVQFTVLPENTVLVCFVMMSRLIDTFTIQCNDEEIDHLERVSNFLNGEYFGESFLAIRSDIKDRSKEEFGDMSSIFHLADKIIEYGFFRNRKNKLIVEGVSNMFQHPDVIDADTFQNLFELLDRKDNLIKYILNRDIDRQRFGLHIGLDLPDIELDTISILNAFFGNYRMNNVGCIGVLGPTRMKYRETMPLVKYFAHLINERL